MLLCSDHWPRTDRRDSGPEPGSAHRGPATDGLGQGPDGVQTAPLCSAWLGAQLGRLKLGGCVTQRAGAPSWSPMPLYVRTHVASCM